MKRLALALIAVLALSGCSMTLDQMRELAEAKRLCNDAGGKFVQWSDVLGNEKWYCNFDEGES